MAWSQLDENSTTTPDEPAEAHPASDSQQEPPPNWVDTSHAVVTDQAQSLVEWMDGFFGDRTYELEKAESFLRLEFENEWDEELGNDFGVQLRGKVQLPKISKKLDLVFSDSDGDIDGLDGQEERSDGDRVALQFKVREGKATRFDATMGFASGNLKPGVRFRTESDFNNRQSYRYVQRIQYKDGDNFFTLGKLDLFSTLSENKVARWSNRFKWGEKTDGVEWRSRLSLFQRKDVDTNRPVALNYFATVSGRTRPHAYQNNYQLGVLWRRQVYRDFLFFEVEPAINYRRREYEDDRAIAWSVVLRMEIALHRNLIKDLKN